MILQKNLSCVKRLILFFHSIYYNKKSKKIYQIFNIFIYKKY